MDKESEEAKEFFQIKRLQYLKRARAAIEDEP
jgi:hypothetical protein